MFSFLPVFFLINMPSVSYQFKHSCNTSLWASRPPFSSLSGTITLIPRRIDLISIQTCSLPQILFMLTKSQNIRYKGLWTEAQRIIMNYFTMILLRKHTENEWFHLWKALIWIYRRDGSERTEELLLFEVGCSLPQSQQSHSDVWGWSSYRPTLMTAAMEDGGLKRGR